MLRYYSILIEAEFRWLLEAERSAVEWLAGCLAKHHGRYQGREQTRRSLHLDQRQRRRHVRGSRCCNWGQRQMQRCFVLFHLRKFGFQRRFQDNDCRFRIFVDMNYDNI